MGKQVWQVGGIRVSIAKRVLIYAFNEYFFKIRLDQKTAEFQVWMMKTIDGVPIDEEDLRYFQEHFYGFTFILIDHEECDMI